MTTTQPVMSESLRTTFTTAILLTGTVKGAETAVLRGIRLMESDGGETSELLHTTVAAALEAAPEPWGQEPEDLDEISAWLPWELQGVLELPDPLRQCFVLRMLMSMPSEGCARLLNLDTRQIDRYASLAARELADICTRRKAN